MVNLYLNILKLKKAWRPIILFHLFVVRNWKMLYH